MRVELTLPRTALVAEYLTDIYPLCLCYSSAELGRWTGITTKLHIQHTAIDGTVPTQYGRLSALGYSFGLFSTAISGSIPSQLGQLTSLYADFYVFGNSVTSKLPTQLGKLSKIHDAYPG